MMTYPDGMFPSRLREPEKARRVGRRLALGAGLAGLGVLGTARQVPAGERSDVVRVAAYPAVDQIVRAAVPAWKRLHPGIQVEVVSREFSDHHTAMTTALSTRSHLPDLMAVEVGYLGRFAHSGGFVDLRQAPYDALRHQSDWVGYSLNQATTAGGALMALPSDIGPGTMFYRKDILDRSATAPEALTATWDDFVAAGRNIRDKTGAYLIADARELKDVMIRHGLGKGEGLYFSSDGKVLVDSPRFVRALSLASRVRKEKLDGKARAWSSEWQEMLRSGKVATQMMGAWLGGHLANWLAPRTQGLWRVSALPENAQVAWGGTFFAIPHRASNPLLAYQLALLLTHDPAQQMAAFRAQDAFPALLSTHRDAFFEEPMPFFGGQPARQLWRQAASRIQAVPVHKYDPLAAEVIDTALDKVLLGAADIREVLAEARKLLEYRLKRP